MENAVLIAVVMAYLAIIAFLCYKGFKSTQSADDFMLAGRQANPFVMALSYGAAFISTSAIIGFGGFAAAYGMSLLWLVFANIFFGIFVAFIFFGKPTRRLGVQLQAHTFPEFLGKFYRSRLIHGVMALIIVLFMPLYASAVLIASAHLIEAQFQISYETSVLVFSVLIAIYVICGGLKGVMFADAFQGSIMFVGMFLLAFFAYYNMGGIYPTHKALDNLPEQIQSDFNEIAVPAIRKIKGKSSQSEIQWLTQSENSKQIEILSKDEKVKAAIDNQLTVDKISSVGFQGWTHFPKTGTQLFYLILTTIIFGVGIGALAQPQLAVRYMTVSSDRELHRAVIMGGIFICGVVGVAYLVGALTNVWFYQQSHRIALTSISDGNIDKIIPLFIQSALPSWFGILFSLTLLSAAVSTLSSLFHAMGTALGRDLIEHAIMKKETSVRTRYVRASIFLSLIVTVWLAFHMPGSIVAIATSTFMGLCAVSFLPMYFAALYWKKATRAGAIASLLSGFAVSLFWMGLVQMPKGTKPAILSQWLFDKASILETPYCWVDVIVIALPVSAIVMIVVSLLTQPYNLAENNVNSENPS